jgi:hypothetical protein
MRNLDKPVAPAHRERRPYGRRATVSDLALDGDRPVIDEHR